MTRELFNSLRVGGAGPGDKANENCTRRPLAGPCPGVSQAWPCEFWRACCSHCHDGVWGGPSPSLADTGGVPRPAWGNYPHPRTELNRDGYPYRASTGGRGGVGGGWELFHSSCRSHHPEYGLGLRPVRCPAPSYRLPLWGEAGHDRGRDPRRMETWAERAEDGAAHGDRSVGCAGQLPQRE